MATLVGQLGLDDFLSGQRREANTIIGDAEPMSGRDGGGIPGGGGVSLLEGMKGNTFLLGRPGNDDVLGSAHNDNGNYLIELRNFGSPWNPWDFDDLPIVRTVNGCEIILSDGFITALGVGDLKGETSASVPIRSGTTCCSTEPRDHVA